MMTDTWTWATVTQATPLRIKVDGDTTALDATTDDLVGSLAVDDRVRVHLHADGIIVTGVQGGGNRSNPNLLINSDFMVNQEGNTSGASVAAYAYFLDGWKNPNGFSTSLYTWADVGGVRTLTIGGPDTPRAARQIIEQQNMPAGTYTLSWEGTATAKFYIGSPPAYSTSPVTVTLDGSADVTLDVRGEGDTVSDIKLERGPVATPYQPPLYGDNLRKCQRYFVRLNTPSRLDVVGWGHQKNTTTVQVISAVPVPMRATPTLTTTGTLAWSDRDTFNSDVSAFGTPTLVGTILQFDATIPSSGAAYRPGNLLNNSYSFAAMSLNARL